MVNTGDHSSVGRSKVKDYQKQMLYDRYAFYLGVVLILISLSGFAFGSDLVLEEHSIVIPDGVFNVNPTPQRVILPPFKFEHPIYIQNYGHTQPLPIPLLLQGEGIANNKAVCETT